ncbi:MAG: endopeptidase La [Clostridia bacterium]|nr:endopeptidase La [Clostridia bacterium]
MEKYNINELLSNNNILPVIPLRGKVAFPHTNISFEVGRSMTLKAVEKAAAGDKIVFILTQRKTEKTDVTPDDLYTVGCVARIKQVAQLSGGALRVLCEGVYRAKARSVSVEGGLFQAVAVPIFTIRGDEVLEEAYFRTAKALVKDVLASDGKISKDALSKLDQCENAEDYIDLAISNMRVRTEVKQRILAEDRIIERFKQFERCLNDELEIAKIEKKIANAVRQNIDQNQKEYFLREQLKAIHSELGDDGKEEDEYRAKVLEKHLPQDLETKCLKEIDRLGKMPSSSAEYTVITSYLEQVLALPWTEETKDTESLKACAKVLDEDHYGLEKIKERITEYLSVLKLTNSMKAPILCFVGPPGVGKTSIAKSIARALNRKFVRMSLGGVKDEAEIRGHRRTYIGAMPGRILYGMKNAGTVNPVFLLDEIDKITSDMHGDPSSALLEVLDPEQNSTFRDRYLEAPYDLSKVLFITTANSLETIPAPLRDRMEIIQLSGYTMEEKLEIARKYLIPKQLTANGLNSARARFTEEGIRTAIEGYTREAGVRTLERTIGTICRKIAVRYADDKTLPKVTVNKDKVHELLGVVKYKKDEERFVSEVGAVNGLAWTAVGGTTLTVEATAMQGKGELKLTGQLGDVMKESALAALSFIRTHAEKYGVDYEKFTTTDLHVHVPEGATPKDGPSAGITMATAILSVLTGRKVRGDVAMTGEITLRGRVLPIGGLKEKALAARRLGIKTVIMPFDNANELPELPEVLKNEITFIPVKRVDEVFDVVLEGGTAFEQYKTEQTPPKARKRAPKALPVISEQPSPRDGVRCK